MEVFTVVVKVLGGVLKALITVFVKLFNLLGDTGGGVIDWISDKWNEFMKQLNNTAFGREIIKAFKWIKEKVGEYLDWIIDKWREVKEFFGFKDDKPKTKNHKSTNDKLNNHLSNTKPTANAVPINRNKPSGGGNNNSSGSPRTARYSAP